MVFVGILCFVEPSISNIRLVTYCKGFEAAPRLQLCPLEVCALMRPPLPLHLEFSPLRTHSHLAFLPHSPALLSLALSRVRCLAPFNPFIRDRQLLLIPLREGGSVGERRSRRRGLNDHQSFVRCTKFTKEHRARSLGGREAAILQGCRMAKFYPFLSMRWVLGWRRNPRKGRDQILQHSTAELLPFKLEGPNMY